MPNVYTAVNCNAPSLSYQVKTPLEPVPTTAAYVVAGDIDLLCLGVSNPTGAAILFTMADGQITPQTIINTSIPAGNTLFVNVPYGQYLYGGFTVLGASAGLIFSARWTQDWHDTPISGGQTPSVLSWGSLTATQWSGLTGPEFGVLTS